MITLHAMNAGHFVADILLLILVVVVILYLFKPYHGWRQ